MTSVKELASFSDRYISPIKAALKEQLYSESPLRNKFQVRPLDEGELPIFKSKKVAYTLNEDKESLMKVVAKYVCVPLFETSCMVGISINDLKGMEDSEIIGKFLSSITILEEERRHYKKISSCLKKGKGIFVIKMDIQVVTCVDPQENKVGFSVFEHVGLVVVG